MYIVDYYHQQIRVVALYTTYPIDVHDVNLDNQKGMSSMLMVSPSLVVASDGLSS